MPWSTNYLQRLNKAQLFVSEQKSEFINALNNCEIKYDCENENSPLSNPNLVMDVRHSMAKTNGTFNFMLPSKEEIQSNAFKQLREENHKKLLNQKNQKLVEKEICKLKKLLSTYQTVREINKDKVYIEQLKTVRHQKFAKQSLDFKNNNFLYIKEINKKVNSLTKSFDCKLKINEKEVEEQSTPPVSNRKGSLVDGASIKREYSWISKTDSGKEEILKKFLQNSKPVDLETEDFNSKNNTQKLSLVDRASIKREYSWISETESGKEEILKKFLQNPNPVDLEAEDFNSKNNTQAASSSSKEKVPCEKESSEADCELNNTGVKEVRVMRTQRSEIILMKTWKAWRTYTLICRRRKIEKQTYENKISRFIAQLQEIKLKKNEQKKLDDSQLNNRSNEKQKLKKESAAMRRKLKQKEMALVKSNENDKKLEQLEKDLKASQAESQARLTALKKRKDKEKEKLLTNNKESDSAREKIKVVPNPKFLMRMEKRKEEREIRRKQILEKKQKLEEERKAILKRVEEEKKMIEEEEKKRKLLEMKQKKEEEKRIRELRKLQILQAKHHYERSLLRNYGLTPWIAFVKFIRLQERNAEEIARSRLLFKVLNKWDFTVKKTTKDREEKADEFHRNLCLKKYLMTWKSVWRERTQQFQVAADWHDFRMVENTFKKWLRITHQSYIVFLNKSQIAQSHYEITLKKRFLLLWKTYPSYKRQEIAKEMRKQVWRQKIQQILPDYQPIDIKMDS